MYLEASAMVLLELHRALEADRRRETRIAARRAAGQISPLNVSHLEGSPV